MKYVISVGGSLVAPKGGIDNIFIGELKQFLKERIELGDRFVIVAGGGATARQYVRAAALSGASASEQDWLGIQATRLNAELLRVSLHPLSPAAVILDPAEPINERAKLLIAGGYKPGRSTDYAAVLLAERIGAKSVINLSNIDYVYDRDPKKYPDAKKIKEISWPNFRKLVGDKWLPGMNAPFDPIASKEAQAAGLSTVIINGHKLEELKKYMDGQKFRGTLIQS